MSPRHKPCIITKQTRVELTGRDVIIDGHHRASLKGCTFEEGARLIAYTHDEAAPSTPTQTHAAPAQAAPSTPTQTTAAPGQVAHTAPPSTPTAHTLELPPELSEARELLTLYKDTRELGAPVALALIAYVIYTRHTRRRRDEDRERPCTRAAEIESLSARVGAIERARAIAQLTEEGRGEERAPAPLSPLHIDETLARLERLERLEREKAPKEEARR